MENWHPKNIRRAYDICSTNEHLQNEQVTLKRFLMNKINTHSGQLITFFVKLNKATTNYCKNNTNNNYHQTHTIKKYQIAKKHLTFPVKGKRADSIIKSVKKTVNKLLPETVNTQIVYTERKLSTCFQIKDTSKFDHQHDLVYNVK